MQGKGAGPVNRVELESQVLCAALRQSFHLRDKIGGFTSVRELSHLFPDLLPPPEKDDDEANSNKSNYYAVLGIKPQSAANGVISAYLRSVRKFLKTKTVKDNRQEYNRILNAGFILRKPRLRVSHDVVVTRRWLHEESRRALVTQQEITVDQTVAVKALMENIQGPLRAESTPAPQPPMPARVAVDPNETPSAPMPVLPPASAKPAVPTPPAPTVPAPPTLPTGTPSKIHSTPPVAEVPAKAPALPNLSEPAPKAPAIVAGSQEVHSVAPPLPPVIAAAMQAQDGKPVAEVASVGVPTPVAAKITHAVPPMPPLPAKFYDPAAYAEPPSSAESAPTAPVVNTPVVPPQPVLPTPAPDAEPVKEAPAAQVAPPPPAVPVATPPENVFPQPPLPVQTPAAEVPVAPALPAAEAPVETYQPPVEPPRQPQVPIAPMTAPAAVPDISAYAAEAAAEDTRRGGRISREATFVFDESALVRPQSNQKAQVPMVIQLLEAAQIIGALEVQALTAQMEFAPNVPVERLILNAGYVNQTELASIKLGESLLQQGRITMAQFQVAIYDERSSGLRMAESLQVRGWLSVEVRNAIDDWHRKRS